MEVKFTSDWKVTEVVYWRIS